MKKILMLILFSALWLNACKKNDANQVHDDDKNHLDDSAVSGEKVVYAPNFAEYLRVFFDNATDKEFLKNNIDFPYAYGSFSNFMVSEAEFMQPDGEMSVFRFLGEQTSATAKPFEGGLNGYLSEAFMKRYGNLNNIYVLEYVPEPTGYLMYFKEINGSFKFIGCELLEIGD